MIPLPTLPEVDYPPLSALNDLLFCERRCFLHRVESLWVENRYTVEGSHSHRRVHETKDNLDGEVRKCRGLRIVSHRLRVCGVADVVEFRADPGTGVAVPFPVEYKRGKRRRWDNDEVQLCAQAICLEEMLSVEVPRGAIFHVSSKRRREVLFTPELRLLTERTAARLHEILALDISPPPVLHPKCRGCSLRSLCLPELFAARRDYESARASLFVPSENP